jgi:hypothetical protein
MMMARLLGASSAIARCCVLFDADLLHEIIDGGLQTAMLVQHIGHALQFRAGH